MKTRTVLNAYSYRIYDGANFCVYEKHTLKSIIKLAEKLDYTEFWYSLHPIKDGTQDNQSMSIKDAKRLLKIKQL